MMRSWLGAAMLLIAALVLTSSPGLAGHAHGLHGAADMQEAQPNPEIAPAAAAMPGEVTVASAPMPGAFDSDERHHHHHPCNDAGCKRISSCVSCVSAIASSFAAMPLPFAVWSSRETPDTVTPAGLPPGKLQRPPRLPS